MKLLTIVEISKEIDVPESNLRYYAKKFEKYIPSNGEGRNKRYYPEAIEIFRRIVEGYKANMTSNFILESLNDKPITVEVVKDQRDNIVQETEIIKAIIQEFTERENRRTEELAALKSQIVEMQKFIEFTFIERDRRLYEKLEELKELKNDKKTESYFVNFLRSFLNRYRKSPNE